MTGRKCSPNRSFICTSPWHSSDSTNLQWAEIAELVFFLSIRGVVQMGIPVLQDSTSEFSGNRRTQCRVRQSRGYGNGGGHIVDRAEVHQSPQGLDRPLGVVIAPPQVNGLALLPPVIELAAQLVPTRYISYLHAPPREKWMSARYPR